MRGSPAPTGISFFAFAGASFLVAVLIGVALNRFAGASPDGAAIGLIFTICDVVGVSGGLYLTRDTAQPLAPKHPLGDQARVEGWSEPAGND